MLSSKEAEFRKGKMAMLKMCQWMETEIIPRVYLSFSAVVADNQYASLGLMLMGCLARVNACVSFPRSRSQSEEAEVEATMKSTKTVIPSEDLGEAITRKEEKLEEQVIEESREKRKKERRKGMLDGERGESASRDASELEAKPTKSSLKREVLDVDGSSEEEQPQPKKAKKVKKVSRKFVEEFDHLSGNSSEEEAEVVPKKVKKVAGAAPKEVHTSESEEELRPVPKKVKKAASSSKAAKPIKKKKKKGGDDFDDLFAGLM